MRRLLAILTLLAMPLAASAEVYWTETFPNLNNWTDYGLGHYHTVSEGWMQMPYPNGGFMDRFTGKTHKQLNFKFTMKLDPGFKIDATGTKVWYLRSEKGPIPQSPNGVLMMIFGNPNLAFVLQGAYDSTDTEIHYTGCFMDTTPKEIEFQWIMNDPGQANGSETLWCNGVQTYTRGGRQYKGPAQVGTYMDTVRAYIQFGQGSIRISNVSVGNSRIGSGSGVPPVSPPVEPPPSPPSAYVTSVKTDGDGANVTLTGKASKLRFWDDTMPKTELSDFTPESLAYRLVRHWPMGATFTCVEAAVDNGTWVTGNYQCAGVTPVPPAPIPPIPPLSVFGTVTVNPLTLSFTYELADCQNVNRRTTGKTKKTVTMTCINDAELRKQKPHKK